MPRGSLEFVYLLLGVGEDLGEALKAFHGTQISHLDVKVRARSLRPSALPCTPRCVPWPAHSKRTPCISSPCHAHLQQWRPSSPSLACLPRCTVLLSSCWQRVLASAAPALSCSIPPYPYPVDALKDRGICLRRATTFCVSTTAPTPWPTPVSRATRTSAASCRFTALCEPSLSALPAPQPAIAVVSAVRQDPRGGGANNRTICSHIRPVALPSTLLGLALIYILP